jgi:glucose-1-phosphate adenylyltransferase
MKGVLAVVLAGGKGSRLDPLTRDRAKPAVPFGGVYRIIDFTLSNCLNSGLRQILVLTQYKAMSLDRHITLGWRNFLCRELGEFIDVVPPQQRVGDRWYQGTADAVYQNIYTLEKERPEYVVILAGDHIYKMDYGKLIAFHQERNAELTIAALRVKTLQAARRFGIMEVDDSGRVIGFEEKPIQPKTIPGNPEYCLASMGIYVFNASFLFEELLKDALLREPVSSHDFGRNVIPMVVGSRRVYAFPFLDENRKKDAYWRDVGTIDSYYEANLELTAVEPDLNLYDDRWPVRTYQPNLPPPKFVFNSQERCGEAHDSIICAGAIISGGQVTRSVIGPQTRVNSYAEVEDSVVFARVNIGRRAKIRRAIIENGVDIPEGFRVGYDEGEDRAHQFTISPGGIVVIAKGQSVEAEFTDPD